MNINNKMKHSINKQLATPILFIIYNKPNTSFKVFRKIKEIKPKYLFIAADGPNSNKPHDKEKCEKARKIIELIDWPCKVKTRFLDKNQGCGLAVGSAITWFFENVEEGIILEDDCLPSNSFFAFCTALLNKYRKDESIWMICGTNFLEKWKSEKQDYHFSRQISLSGWATWKRAWKNYKYDIRDIDKKETIKKIVSTINDNWYSNYLLKKIEQTRHNLIDSWGYRWMATFYKKGGKIIVPSKNMIDNIGFSSEAAHTKNPFSWMANIKTYEMKFPLLKTLNENIDITFDKKVISERKSLWNRISNKIFEIINK